MIEKEQGSTLIGFSLWVRSESCWETRLISRPDFDCVSECRENYDTHWVEECLPIRVKFMTAMNPWRAC
jgi:hypothetical protein